MDSRYIAGAGLTRGAACAQFPVLLEVELGLTTPVAWCEAEEMAARLAQLLTDDGHGRHEANVKALRALLHGQTTDPGAA